MNDLQKIGLSIQKKRFALDLSQEDLAGMAEIDRSYLSGIENGKRRLSMDMFIRLSKALQTEPWAILKDALDK